MPGIKSNVFVQAEEAKAWRDKSLGYFAKFSGRPIPAVGGRP